MAKYVKQTWVNGDPTKPVNATRLGHVEDGVLDSSQIIYEGRLSDANLTSTIGAQVESNETLDFLGLVMAPISPARYGASTDGSGTNDAPAIQLAINAAQDRGYRGGSVTLKTHTLTSPVVISSHNITLEGGGGTLRGRGIEISRPTTAADIFTRVENLTIDMLSSANGDAVKMDRAGRISFSHVRIFNAASGFFVPARDEHQHVRRVLMSHVEVSDCDYGWFSVQPGGNTTRYTVGDLQITNSEWYNNKVVMRAEGLDGLNISTFKSFQHQRADRDRAFDLGYINFANFNGVNIFEPGREGLQLSRFQNFHWHGGNIAWPGQLVPASGIVLTGGDLGGAAYSMSSFAGITIQKPTKHGMEIEAPVDRVVIDPSVIVQGAGDPEFYTGDSAALAAINPHYGFVTPSAAVQIRALGTTVDRGNSYQHSGETQSLDSLRIRNTVKTKALTGVETSIDMSLGYTRVTCSQSAPSTITLITQGQTGDELVLCGVNGNTTIAHGGSGGATVRLKGAVNATIPANGILTLFYTNSSWTEKNRSW